MLLAVARYGAVAWGDRLRRNDWDDPERCPIRIEQHCPLARSIAGFGMHQHAPAQSECTLYAGRHIGDLDVRHPLERKLSIFGAARAQADDRYAQVVHQIFLAPKRTLSCAEHTRVEAYLALVLGNGDIGAEDGADAWDKQVAHRVTPG